jgi:hypothetical protein
MILNLQIHEYLDGVVMAEGFRIVVHDQKQLPLPESMGFSVGAGDSSMVAIKSVR